MKLDPIKETIKTYETIAKDFTKKRSNITINEVGESKTLAEFFVKNIKGNKILDIGCGPGAHTKYFYKKGFDVIGIDLSENFIKIATENNPKVKFFKMDMRKLEFKDDTFDGIWCMATFFHVSKREAKSTLSGFKRVLKPNGLMHISVKEGVGEKLIKSPEFGEMRFYAFYREKEFEHLLKSCGFTILKSSIDEKKDTWLNFFVKNKG